MAIKGVVQMDKLAHTIMSNLNEYVGDVAKEVEIAAEKNAKLGVKLLRQSSPQGIRKRYVKGWRAKKLENGQWIIHNATDYQLTHLLEKGHAKVGGGRTSPQVHIKPVEEYVSEMFEQDIREAIKR